MFRFAELEGGREIAGFWCDIMFVLMDGGKEKGKHAEQYLRGKRRDELYVP